MMADAGQSSGHFGQEHHAQGANGEHPEHLHTEGGAGECRRRDGADIKEATDARRDAERDVHDVLHSGLATAGVFSAGTSEAAAWPDSIAARRSPRVTASAIAAACDATAFTGAAAASPDFRAVCSCFCRDVRAWATTVWK